MGRRSCLWFLVALMFCLPLAAQQVGSISGTVTSTDGSVLPGVTVEAKSKVLPQPRVTVTSGSGEYRMPQLQPGIYTVTFSLAGLQTVTRNTTVLLNQNSQVDVALGVAGLSESITVTAQETLVDKTSAAIGSAVSNEEIQALPIAQEYKDLQKLIPGVMVSQDAVRGPSGGGSGQDNVYLFDGVNVTMPLFGVAVAEPATHDIAQFSVLKGGAKAVDFERAAGFSVDSVSKSGTNEFAGQVSYQLMNNGFIADQEGTVNSRFAQDREWLSINFGGPVLRDQLFFYGSYYKPTYTRDNASNLYGDLPGYESERDEYFGKLTYTPTQSWLINGSYRKSNRKDIGDQFASNQTASTAFGYETELEIGTLEGSWIVNPVSYATFKYTDFKNPGNGFPAVFSDAVVSTAPGTHLDIANLDKLGLLRVPTPITGNAAQSAFVQPYIDKYGYVQNGVRTGGGLVGSSSLAADDDDFFRKNAEIGFNYTIGAAVKHDLHIGYQRYTDEEDRFQLSNGWGSLTIPAGTVNCPATACGTLTPAFFQATFAQQSTGQVPVIHSEIHSQSFEVNDTIRMNDWTFSLGLLASNDTFYGQGLKEADNIAGFVASPGEKYKMYDVPFSRQLQPRLSTTWAYNGQDTVYVSWARYNPAVSSLPRAASWDRNLVANIDAYFDANGVLLGVAPVRSSSGKLFVEELDPRVTTEYMIGTGQQLTSGLSVRAYGRYRYSTHFWEDTNNDARVRYGAGVPGVEQALYIDNLSALRTAIGSGSSYVIAELDGAFTKYYEGTMEADYGNGPMSLRGSYTWSHYYGNFDQDNSSFNTANDTSIFIGSSNIADGAGRQIWDNKYGDLRGDRRHVLKLYGTYQLPWRASVGTFGYYQSGQPYQLESYLPYKGLTTSTSDTARYAEPAGRRKSPSHHQVDLNYTQNFPLPRGLNIQLLVDIFNIYDNQTGYNYETRIGTLGTCNTNDCIATDIGAAPSVNRPYAKSFYDPRRFQVAARIQF